MREEVERGRLEQEHNECAGVSRWIALALPLPLRMFLNDDDQVSANANHSAFKCLKIKTEYIRLFARRIQCVSS